MQSFVSRLRTPDVIFGSGSNQRLVEELARLGAGRALVLTTDRGAAQLRKAVGAPSAIADIFTGARMHTPYEVTERAMVRVSEMNADCLISFGGGSSIGLAKALALRTGLPHVAMPTTYSGSEMTSIVGETEGGRKRTTRHDRILPRTVIYDVNDTTDLPLRTTLTSAVNAIAHGVETLYAENGNPFLSMVAEAGIADLVAALEALPRDLGNREARHRALYGAWLCGMGLNNAGMALHHKLCHVIGGAFDLPHAETHTIVLPHAISYNAEAAPSAFARMQRAFAAARPQDRLRELAAIDGVPRALRELGMPEDGIVTVVERTLEAPYWNPRPLERDALLALVTNAWRGDRPA
ncbi:MAG: maleylacetate reductase [Methylobacteriaceae bacterium]|nr:maleylacetate reductase [Methylobacteriaceae bacterium]